VRERVRAADILVVGTPTWMGHMSSIAQRVLERLDAELSETDAEGRPILAGKVVAAAVVGNEDGAHKITADRDSGRRRRSLRSRCTEGSVGNVKRVDRQVLDLHRPRGQVRPWRLDRVLVAGIEVLGHEHDAAG
jgi:hypothetical protein